MLRSPAFVIGTACLLFASTTATGEPLAPTGKWVVDYRTDQCLASREYGTPDNPITLGIRPALNGQTYLLVVARKHFGPLMAEESQGGVDFGEGVIKSWLLEYESKPSGNDLYQFRISTAEMEQAKTASHLKLNLPHAPAMDLQLVVMGDLLKALEDCTANLRRYWNADGVKDGTLGQYAKGNLRRLFSSDDYPEEALFRGQGGTSQLVLLVDQTGKVAGCDVLVPSGVPILDIMGCQVIMNRARFAPATDKAGKPIRSMYVTPPITWEG